MTENRVKNTTYTSNSLIHIPSREEFHKEFAGTLSTSDFCTEAPRNHTTIYYTQKELNAKRVHRENCYKKLINYENK